MLHEQHTRPPEHFDIASCAVDFAGPGRKIEVTDRVDQYSSRRQMRVRVNDWTISCVWGFGTYSTAARPRPLEFPDHPAPVSPDAEVAAWRGADGMIEIDGDTVAGWRTPGQVVAALEAAAQDDEAGIRAALTDSEENPVTNDRYPVEMLDSEDDDGTMPANVADLAERVVGHRIVAADNDGGKFTLTLDTGARVVLRDTSDCCAYTELEKFLLNPAGIDHVITGVGTTEGYTKWHIYADFGDVVQLDVGWSCGNPFYYGYGFDIAIEPASGGPDVL